MNIAVINLKQLIKYTLCFILILTIISLGITALNGEEELEENLEEAKEEIFDKPQSSSLLYCLKLGMPLISVTNEEEETQKITEKTSERILSTQLAMMYNIEEALETAVIETEENLILDAIAIEENVEDEEIEELENLKTEVISENNIDASFTDVRDTVQVNNQTSYDIKDLLANVSYELTNKEKILIYHTHTCESYTSSEKYKYEMTGAYRTTDLNYTVSRVGDELEKHLKEYEKTVVHDKTYHDYPAYNGSYGRSLKTMESVLATNQDAEISIDLHRDAVGSSNTYGPTVKIGDEVCAQLMFVIGTDGSGLYHPNWRKNLQFAVKVQQVANEMYPRTF